MQNICDSFIRCFCSCLINKNPVTYNEVNEQHHQFMKNNETISEAPNYNPSQKQYGSQNVTVSTVVGKFSSFLAPENQALNDDDDSTIFHNVQQHQKQIDGNSVSQLLSFTDVIKQDHSYYHLFKDKLPQLPNIFHIPQNAWTAQPDTQYKLKLHCYQEGKLNSFKYFFTFPTDFNTYQTISNDFELQAKFDANIQSFTKTLQSPEGDAKRIYLAYKKVLIMSSRDFDYVRYSFKKEGQYWNICVSDPSRPQIKGKVRGDLYIVTRIIERKGDIDVSVASTTDMKMPIKLQMAKNRGFAEIRKYLDKVYNHIKDNQSKSII